MNENDQERLLMSDSLQGMVPEIEDQINEYEDSVIIVGISYTDEVISDFIAGAIVGVSFESEVIKIDFRKATTDSYKFFKFCVENPNVKCNILYLQNRENEMLLQGPFKITSPKLTDLNYKEKSCTVSLDLIKISS